MESESNSAHLPGVSSSLILPKATLKNNILTSSSITIVITIDVDVQQIRKMK